MPATKPAPLCTFVKPSGLRCGAPAMRNKRFCYHHNGNHREYTRERLIIQRLERLSAQYDEMNAGQLLNVLHSKLVMLQKTLRRFPEVSFTLTYTLDRLDEITSFESIAREMVLEIQELQSMSSAPHSKQRP